MGDISVTPVTTRRDRKAFIDLAYRLNADDPNWVAPLRADVAELLDRKKNPFFQHAEMQMFLARRTQQTVRFRLVRCLLETQCGLCTSGHLPQAGSS